MTTVRRGAPRGLLRWVFASIAYFGLSACAARHVGTDGKTPADIQRQEPTKLDPMRVKAQQQGGRLEIDAYDAQRLFDRAAAQLRLGNCDEAVVIYTKLAQEFPESRFVSPSLYNSGLCNEQLERFDKAAAAYETLIANFPGSNDVTDALFKLAGIYEKAGRLDDAEATYERILEQRKDLEGVERVEALARKGAVLIGLGRPDEAVAALDQAVHIFRTGQGISPSDSRFYYGMAQFYRGEIIRDRMHAVVLPQAEDEIEPALEHKCQLLLDAQFEYTRTIKVAHPHWAAAAAYRIGNLYRTLWDDILGTPPPTDLTDEEKEIYLEVLRDKLRVLLEKAVKQWERTLKMARRLNLDNEWVDKTTLELEEIRALLLDKNSDEHGKAEAERATPPEEVSESPLEGQRPGH